MIQILKGHCRKSLRGLFQPFQILVIRLKLICLIKHPSAAVSNQYCQPVILLMHNRQKDDFLLSKGFQQYRKTLAFNALISIGLYILCSLYGGKLLPVNLILLNQRYNRFTLRRNLQKRQQQSAYTAQG